MFSLQTRPTAWAPTRSGSCIRGSPRASTVCFRKLGFKTLQHFAISFFKKQLKALIDSSHPRL